jgi:hypothetical protein
MRVTAEQVSALRTYLTLDPDTVEQNRHAIVDAGSTDGFSALLYAALQTATSRRFRPGWIRADIVRYVADIRTRSSENIEIDPVAAETILRRALGEKIPSVADEAVKARTQALLLAELTADADLDEIGLDAFVAQSRQLADQWVAEHARS